MPLSVGVLIIGSLLWDSKNGRPTWRNTRLDMATAKEVTAPIRYGRRSRSRGNTYTMVFSRLCQVGHAKLVHCSHEISAIQDLTAEAEFLWKAEQPDAKADRIAANWGCVALMCNPGRDIPEHLLSGWAERVGREPDYGNISQTPEEGVLVSSGGLLQIGWPGIVDGGAPADVDLLLVTANDPEITTANPTYPSPTAIAVAWNRVGDCVQYFWRNTDNGICTFEDDEIRKRLRPREGGAHDFR